MVTTCRGLAIGAFAIRALAIGAPAVPAAPAAAQLAPHRAVYELSLEATSPGLADAHGAFAIEWRQACSGTASQQRLWFVGRTQDGGTFDYDVRFATWESNDSSTLRFTMRSFAAGELVEEFRGTASMPNGGGPGGAVYTLPEGLEVRLPPGTVFPTRHLEQLIAAARAGERVTTSDLFDGAGDADDALAAVTAVIGDRVAAEAAADEAWPVALAYHPLRADDVGMPAFELSFDLTGRGVMRRVVLDYGDFALRARLDEIEMLTPQACE